jgi:hypothetical protein
VDYHAIGVGAHDQGVGVLQREGTIAGGNVGAHEAPWRQRIMPPLARISVKTLCLLPQFIRVGLQKVRM